ncbi:MAG: nitroreductase family protein [Eubacterium sp.]
MLKAGMAAPVGSNAYASLHLTVIQDMDILNEIGEAVNEFVFKMLGKHLNKNFGAPTMIVVSAKPGRMPGIKMANTGTVLENMAIAATDMGIDSIIWGGASAVIAQNPTLREKLQIPEGYTPTLSASFGYATEPQAPRQHSITVNRI